MAVAAGLEKGAVIAKGAFLLDKLSKLFQIGGDLRAHIPAEDDLAVQDGANCGNSCGQIGEIFLPKHFGVRIPSASAAKKASRSWSKSSDNTVAAQ